MSRTGNSQDEFDSSSYLNIRKEQLPEGGRDYFNNLTIAYDWKRDSILRGSSINHSCLATVKIKLF